MEKLIELLNEYSLRYIKNKYLINWEIGENPIGIYGYVREYGLGRASKLIIISKEFGFIKWLVDNDKIYREGMKGHGRLISYCLYIKSWEWDKIKEGVLLMLLSIQDNPIEFLINILK